MRVVLGSDRGPLALLLLLGTDSFLPGLGSHVRIAALVERLCSTSSTWGVSVLACVAKWLNLDLSS